MGLGTLATFTGGYTMVQQIANAARSESVSGRHRPRDITERAADFIAGRGASARLGGSNYGSMCEAAAHFAHSSVRCGRCDGFGFLGIDREELALRGKQLADEHNPDKREALRIKWNRDSTCNACRGTGFLNGSMVASEMDSMFTTVRCPDCKASGKNRRHRHTTRDDALTLLGFDAGTCARCHGTGYLVPVDVRETGSSKSGKLPPGSTDAGVDEIRVNPLDPAGVSDWADDGALLEFAQMSRLMDRLRAADETSAQVLDRFHGIEGDRYGAHVWGRAFAIWPMTHAGKQIAKESAEESKLGSGFLLTPMQRIANERNRQDLASVPNLRMRALMGRADREARSLLDRAHKALREAARP